VRKANIFESSFKKNKKKFFNIYPIKRGKINDFGVQTIGGKF